MPWARAPASGRQSPLVVSEDCLGLPAIQDWQGCTVQGDVVEFLGEAVSRAQATNSLQPVSQCHRDRLCLGLSGELGQSFCKPLGF